MRSTYFTLPPELPREYRRVYVLGLYAYPAIGAFHFGWIFLFAGLGVSSLAWLNVLSSALWALGLALHRRLHVDTALTVVLTEICVHAIAASTVFGLEAGYQYYLIPSTGVVFLFPGRHRLRALLATASAGLFIALYLYLDTRPVAVPVEASVVRVLAVSNILSVCFVVSVVLYYYSRAAESAELALAVAHERSEELLHNILPGAIAERLKGGEAVIADRIDCASVLFADIVSFTPMAERMSPASVVSFLNQIFSEIDDLVVRHGLEKIKMIGDAYMVAAGVPERRADHACAIADFALALRALVERHRFDDGGPLRMRIGIDSGPVIVGVIGKRKFAYDMWGDTVNTAARMESHGLPGEIQISSATRRLLGNRYEFEERGVIEVKGKGGMTTFLLRGRRSSCPSPEGDLDGRRGECG